MTVDRQPRSGAPATTSLLIAILIGFGIEVLTGAWTDGEKLAELGAVAPWFIWEDGEYWRLLTAMFLHGNILHLTLNLLALFQIGTLFEISFGTRRFVLTYFTAGIAASLTSAAFNDGPSVGASGAIFGVIGAFIVTVRRSQRLRRAPVPRSIVNQLLFWVVANTVIALQLPQIDMAAHTGGLFAGAFLSALLPRHEPPPPPPSEAVVDVLPYDR